MENVRKKKRQKEETLEPPLPRGKMATFLLSSFKRFRRLSASPFPLQRAFLHLVEQTEDQHAEEKQNRSQNRDVLGEKLAIDERPWDQNHDLEIKEHEERSEER